MISTTKNKIPSALIALASLFFFWGFLTCLNDILVPHLRAVFSLSYFESALIQGAFFLSYFCSSIPAGTIVGRYGFKSGIVLGLCIAALGAFMFVPASLFTIFPLFLLALFVLASGITMLQVAANPLVTILGSKETASSRLNLTQAFNSIGTTIAPAVGGWLILSSDVSTLSPVEAAQSVNVPYISMGALLLLLAFLFTKLKLTKTDVSLTPVSLSAVKEALAYKQLSGGVLGIFVYVGAEVSIGSFLVNYVSSHLHLAEKQAAVYVSIYWGLAAIGRLLGSVIMRKVSPGYFLAASAAAAITLIMATIYLDGIWSVYAILSVGLCNSIMFPTIFSLGVRGLGNYTNVGSSLLVMAIVGGAVVPLLMGFCADSFGLQWSFLLPAACYLYIAIYGRNNSARD